MYCPRCGIENQQDAETCVSCGNDLRTWGDRLPDRQAAPGQPSVYAQPPPQPQQPYAPPAGQPSGQPRIPNYLVQSIVLAVLGTCCWIIPTALAIPAIVFGSQVNAKLRVGDTLGAAESSRNARIWCWLSFGSLVIMVLAFASLIGLPFLFEA